MDAAKWARIKDIFSAVVDLDPEERVRLTEELSAGDRLIRAEVEALITANNVVENFIEEPAFAAADVLDRETDPSIGRVVGNYCIVREIGRGGMGTVFLARRNDGEFRQEVALKVISSAYLGVENLRRFRQERQILAALNHPNIARLLDGGVTDDGLPYIVMEYVDGKRLLDHAETQDLSFEERLRLFVKICDAVAYSHRNLVVHRDLKPSNILVTAEGEPKLLDFGLAKMLSVDSNSEQTKSHFRALTPAYASPEHLRGETITTASDVYSLGVALYELLTGSRPFELESLVERMTGTDSVSAPAKPSARIPANHSTIRRQNLHGDVDNIVLTAIRYEPERRYASVEKFADDLRRHLKGLPVSATESTFGYRTSKFLRRNRLGVASAALILLILAAGITATVWQAREAHREQAKATRVTSFLQTILGSVAPEARGTNVTMREALDEASTRARTEFADSPEILADVLMTTGRTYASLTVNDRAETDLREALEISRRLNGDGHPTTLGSIGMLGIALAFLSKSEEAEKIAREAVELNRRYGSISSENLGMALYAHSISLIQLGKADAALPAALEASEAIRDSLGEQHGYFLATLNAVALARQLTGDRAEAERLFREVIDRGRQMENRFRIYVAQASSFLAWQLIDDRKLDEAQHFSSEAKRLYAEVLGDSTVSTAISDLQIGTVFFERGDYAAAEPSLRQSLELFAKNHAATSPYAITASFRLGRSLLKQGKPAEAEPLLRTAIEQSPAIKPDNRRYYEIRFLLIESLLAQGRNSIAAASVEELEKTARDNPAIDGSVFDKLAELKRSSEKK
jgi:eukaryotic-like serine/threonine-protein kinase